MHRLCGVPASCEAPRLVIIDSTGTVRLAGLTMCRAAQSGAERQRAAESGTAFLKFWGFEHRSFGRMLGEEKALFTVCLAWSCFVVALSCSSVIWPSSTAQRTYIVLAVHALSGVREIRVVSLPQHDSNRQADLAALERRLKAKSERERRGHCMAGSDAGSRGRVCVCVSLASAALSKEATARGRTGQEFWVCLKGRQGQFNVLATSFCRRCFSIPD